MERSPPASVPLAATDGQPQRTDQDPQMDISRLQQTAQRLANRALTPAGIRVGRADGVGRNWHSLFTHLKRLGFRPDLVLDVGTASGTRPIYDHFPDARYVLYEPLSEFEPQLAELEQSLDATIVRAAVGREPGEIELHVHPDLIGSSVYRETSGGGDDGEARTVPIVTLDDTSGAADHQHVLLKIDVQGAELEVLEGGRRTLESVEVLIVECSLIATLQDSPEIHDVMAWAHDAGFSLFDVIGGLERPLDGSLAQLDTVFVPTDHPWRSDGRWQALS